MRKLPKIEASSELEKVIGEVIRQRDSGVHLDDSTITQQFAHLMPELGQRLHTLRMIEEAGAYAEAHPESTLQTEIESVGPTMGEDFAFLRGALTGYEMLERVHHGGQGVVYKAVQQSTSRVVAVKVLLHGPLATERQRYRFAREVEINSRLRHPNIVTLYDSGIVRGRPYFAMEYIEGLPIDDHVLLHDLAVRRRVELFVVICRAVACAHQNGIIHRDLKPSNILVDSEGVPHILDFGLAKDLYTSDERDDMAQISMPGQVVGTLPYLSPEQAGFGGLVDLRADIYSMGVMLHQLLTGTFPYPITGDREAVRLNILSREPTPLRKALEHEEADQRVNRRELNDDLEAIVLKALDKTPAGRYQSADAMAADLDRWLKHDAVEAKADRRFYVLKKTVRKYRVHATIAAGFLVLLVAGLVGVIVAWQKAKHVAKTSQEGLAIVALHRRGDSYRDEGRIDDAIDILKKASEIGQTVTSSDPVLRRFRYAALHDLAELYTDYKSPQEAIPYCEAATALAEQLVRDDPSDVEWQRRLAASFQLRGRLALARDDLPNALDYSGSAIGIMRTVVATDPTDTRYQRDLANVLSLHGRCLQDHRQYDKSFAFYDESRRIFQNLADAYPGAAEFAIELSRTEVKIAVWHLHQRTAQHDQAASTSLMNAEDRLIELRNKGLARGRELDFQAILSALEANRELLVKRAAKRTQIP